MSLLLFTACAGGTKASTASTASTIALQPSTSTVQTSPSTTPVIPTPASTVPASPRTTAPAAPASTTTTAVDNAGACGRTTTAPTTYDHVIWIWMENKDRKAVFDSQHAPFMHQLAETCGTAANYIDHGIRPSLPNYIAATSGGTQGVKDDGFPRDHRLRNDNIFRQVRAIGKVSRSYAEAMRGNCSLDSTDRYAVKHNPAAYYVGGDDRAACQQDNVSFDHFLQDLGSDLPAFSSITPDMCNDMHDCSVSTGDKWLQSVVSSITASPTYNDGKTAVFVVFDESEGAGNMPFIAIAPSIKPGTTVDTELDHYALLAFTEAALGIDTRLGKAAQANNLADAFGL